MRTCCGLQHPGAADGPGSNGTAPPPAPMPAAAPVPVGAGAMRVSYRRLSQGNLCLGMPGVARDDPDRWALDLLGAVLGDGMGSRLFLDLRERRSLVYDVSTFSAMYADTGTFGIHAGFDPEEAGAVVDAIVEQLDRVSSEPVALAELDRARAYTRGRLELRMEDSGAVAGWIGTGETLLPQHPDGRGGDRAARRRDGRGPAARGARLPRTGAGAPGRAGSVPVARSLRARPAHMSKRREPGEVADEQPVDEAEPEIAGHHAEPPAAELSFESPCR